MKTQTYRKFALRTIPFLITTACATNAFAQQGMDEVVVSAQKRTQRIQDVPMAISAISGQALEDRKIEGASDLQGSIPNVNIVAAPVSGLIATSYIRGLGTGQPSIWMDPAVGMYVDGVFVGKNQGALFDMLDLERVEVLRGPQGSLFGRNTLGGAINFVTRQPSGQFSGNVGLEMGNYGRLVEKISIDTPKINNILSMTIAARKEKQDGWLNNPSSTDKWGSRGREAFKFNAKLDVSKDTKFLYSLDRSDIDETTTPMSVIKTRGYCSYAAIIACSTTTTSALDPRIAAGVYIPAANDMFTNGMPIWVTRIGRGGAGAPFYPADITAANIEASNARRLPANGVPIAAALQNGVPTSTSSTPGFSPNQKLKVTGHSWTGETAINTNNTLKYMGSYREMKYNDVGDYDGSSANIFSGVRETNYKTHSHELQLVGSTKDINYVGGLYYFKDNGDSVQNQIGTFYSLINMPTGILRGQTNFGVGTEAKAVFGQADFKVDEKNTLTTGLRFTEETKTGSIARTPVGAALYNPDVAYVPNITVTDNKEAKFSATTPSVALSHKLDANTLVFGRIAKGFKSGGFPLEAKTQAQAMTAFKPETSTSYELGVKGANATASYAATAFVTKLKDQQISYLPVGSTNPTTTNAGASTYQGFELEGALKVSKDTKIQAGYGYLDAKFNKFLAEGIRGGIVDAASNLVVGYAPKHTLNLNVESHLTKTQYGRLKGLVEYRYTAAYYNYAANKSMTADNTIPGNYAPDSKMPALGTINARLTLDQISVGGPGQADASIWVKNATNKQVLQNMMDVSGYYQVGYWSNPRTLGVTLNYKW